MSKLINGVCHICGEVKKLTYEHIPPRATGNSTRTKSYDGIAMARVGRLELKDVEGLRGNIQQQGAGAYTLCADCNSYTGSHYAEHYSHAIIAAHRLFQSFSDTQGNVISFESKDLKVLAFFKQIIAMFCSIRPAGEMIDCKDFLLNKNCKNFNHEKYRVTMVAIRDAQSNALQSNGEIRVFNAHGNIRQDFSAFLCYPLGFLLYIDGDSGVQRHGADITLMADFNYDETPHFGVSIPCVDTQHIIPSFLREESVPSSK